MTCALRCTSVNATTEMADGDTARTTPVIKDAPITYKSDVWANFGFYELNGKLEKTHAVCKVCHTKIRYFGNTTNVTRTRASERGHIESESNQKPASPQGIKYALTCAKQPLKYHNREREAGGVTAISSL